MPTTMTFDHRSLRRLVSDPIGERFFLHLSHLVSPIGPAMLELG